MRDEKEARTMSRRLFIVIGIVVVFLITAVVLFLFVIAPQLREQRQVRNMSIQTIDLKRVSEGTFRGDFTYDNFTYEVEVSVKNHKIQAIAIMRNRSTGYAKKAEGIVRRIINSQSLQIDAITGATTTSKALLKAIENALSKGIAK
jgi:uncharacterized protein with FMN-binding domain